MHTAHANLSQAPFHTLRVVASFALLGAVIAGSATIFPVVATAATAVDLHALGAVVGGVAGAVTQVLRN